MESLDPTQQAMIFGVAVVGLITTTKALMDWLIAMFAVPAGQARMRATSLVAFYVVVTAALTELYPLAAKVLLVVYGTAMVAMLAGAQHDAAVDKHTPT